METFDIPSEYRSVLINSVQHGSIVCVPLALGETLVFSPTQCIYDSQHKGSYLSHNALTYVTCVFQTNCVTCKTGTQFSSNIKLNFIVKNWLGGYLQAFQYEDPGFDPRSVHVIFSLGNVALGQNFIPVLRLYPVSIIPHLPHTHLHFNIILIRRTGVKILGTFKETNRKIPKSIPTQSTKLKRNNKWSKAGFTKRLQEHRHI